MKHDAGYLITLAASTGGIGRVTPAGTNDAGDRLVKIEGQGKPWADTHPLNGLAWSADPRLNGGTITEQTITLAEWYSRQVIAAAIMLAGSAGDPRARRLRGAAGAGGPNVPAGGLVTIPSLPATSNVCRGLWQFDSVTWKMIPDAVAFDARASTAAVFAITDGFRPDRFTAWSGSPGLDPASPEAKAAHAALAAQKDAVTDLGVFGLPGEASLYNAIEDAASGPVDLLKALGELVANLLDPQWWKRIGVGAAGVLLLLLVFLGARSERARTLKVE